MKARMRAAAGARRPHAASVLRRARGRDGELHEVKGERQHQGGEGGCGRQSERGRGGALVSDEGQVDVGGAGRVVREAARFQRCTARRRVSRRAARGMAQR